MNCAACTQRMRQREENKRAKALRKEQGIPELESIPTISLDDMRQSLESRRGQVLSLDAYVVLPQNLELPELESRRQKPGTEDVFRLANAVRNAIHRVTGFRWRCVNEAVLPRQRINLLFIPSQKKRTPTNGDKATVVTYHCAQLEEERPKHKERARVGTQPRYSMQRYHCNGWLNIYVTHGDSSRVRVRLTHDLVHPYPTHSKPEKMAASGMQSMGDDRTSVNITEQGQGNKRIRTADESQETLWIPPVVASSCLPPSVNKDRVSLNYPSPLSMSLTCV